MAVSGRRLTDSVLKSSAEDFDHKCDPCLIDNQHVEAKGFCVTCREYLCENCLKFHKRTRALKHHELLDKDKMVTYKTTSVASTSETLTERCMIHKDELIKFFCPKHEALGCSDCITMNHRTCKIDYIPDKCSGIEDSKDFTDILQKLDQNLKVTEGVMKKAETKDKEIDNQYDGLIVEIEKYRKEINDRLDQKQREMFDRASERRSKDKKVVKESLDVCSINYSDMQKLQQKLKESDVSDQKGQIYIAMKQACSKLKSDTIKTAESSLDDINVQYTFIKDVELEKMLLKKEAFGEVRLTTIVSRKGDTSKSLKHIDDINVKTKSDKMFFKCNVIGCAALASNKVVLIDSSNNKKLKVVDTERKTIIDEKILEPPPSGITALPNNNIAVTFPEQKEIWIMKTADEIECVRRIKLEETCQRIASDRDRLFVLCKDPKCILILNLQGNVLHKFSLENEVVEDGTAIAYSTSDERLYINDPGNSRIVIVTMNGEIFKVYENNDLQGSHGILVLSDGSLLVGNGTDQIIYHLTRDLDKLNKEAVGVKQSYSMCSDPQQKKVYTGSYNSDLLKVFSWQ